MLFGFSRWGKYWGFKWNFEIMAALSTIEVNYPNISIRNHRQRFIMHNVKANILHSKSKYHQRIVKTICLSYTSPPPFENIFAFSI